MRTFNTIGGAMCFYGAFAIGGSEVWMPWSQVIAAALFAATLIFVRRINT